MRKMPAPKKIIPFHRRFGLRLLQVLLVIFALVLVKRCVVIYQENRYSGIEQEKIEYFEKGYTNGFNTSVGLNSDPEPNFEHYALEQAYRNGYRKGWDQGKNIPGSP